MILLATQPSTISMSSITEAMFELELLEAEVEKNLFLVSLIGTTIQDGGKRERRYVHHITLLCLSLK